MKRNRIFFTALLSFGISLVLTIQGLAQKTAEPDSGKQVKTCSGEKFVMPSNILSTDEAFLRYLAVASAPVKERRAIFAALSGEQKASVVKMQYAMQLAKRPDLTKPQSDFILEAISKVTPDLFDRTDPEKIRMANAAGQDIEMKGLAVFSRKDAFEILSGIQADKQADVELMQRYQAVLESGMAQRRKLVNEMQPAERIGVWKTQLAFHLAVSKLSAGQQKFIADIMPNIHSIFEASANLSAEERAQYLKDLESGIFRVFSKAEAYAIFMSIGIQKKVDDPAGSLSLPDCNCRWYCDKDEEGCSGSCRTVTGCGPFDSWDCTGRCLPG